MASWPTVEMVRRRLGITRTDDGVDQDVQLALNAAIETVEMDAATWLSDQDGVPDSRLSAAALVLAVSTYKAPDAPYGVAGVFDVTAIAVRDQLPQYLELLRGHRTEFGIA